MALRKLPLPRKAAPPPPVMPEERLPSNTPQPEYKPLHPGFVGKSKVLVSTAHKAKALDGDFYLVDLGAGTCTCKNGGPWQWHIKNEAWARSQCCSHKIRAMADILEKKGRPADMQAAYSKEVGSRYNMYEVVSAFHKELRIGNVERAVFWGTMLANFRGSRGIIKYLLNILYEETRDHTMGDFLLDLYLWDDRSHDYANMCIGIKAFCQSKKKWQIPTHYDCLMAEMRGYAKLVAEFGRKVAEGGNIIADEHKPTLMSALKSGIANKDAALAQYGLKGLQKLKTGDIDSHRAWIINELMAMNSPRSKSAECAKLMAYIQRRATNKLGIGYHELNNLVDFLLGEPYGAGNTPPATLKASLAFPTPVMRLGVAPAIPLYAHDNHTWAGKALLRRYPTEWQPGAVQEHFDLRLCGAYMGVVWRHLAVKQHGAIDVKWADVEWPKWLHETVSNLWY
ncbi:MULTISPECIES: hypothetical protein [unclassified Bradyrhizobium]|uniref:hypothetical protein n=1 Tax=unclassified Bradyrhizobium TaxID=2631580 RepID=UPI003396B540